MATAGLAITVALWLGGAALFVPAAQAVTVAELQAQIAALQAQLASLTGSSADCFSFTRDLFAGLSGDDVEALQDYLTGTGHFSYAGGSTGYFGPITTAAVAAWQTANGVSPAAGYFGPISRAKYNTVCTGGADDDDGGSSDLEGGAGSIETYKLMANLSSEQVGEGEEDVEVAGLTLEVDDGSDIMVTAVRLNFDQGSGASSDFDKYVDEVSVWVDGEEFARVDGDKFNDDNNYASTISLDDGGIIRAGEEGELVVAVSAVNNLDSADETDTWTIDFTSVRFEDGNGASTSEDPTTATRSFTFESLTTASDAELVIAEDDADVNTGHTINVASSTKTSNVELLSFTLEAEGDSDLDIEKFGVNLDVTGATSVDHMLSGGTAPALYLEIEGERYGTASYFDDADGSEVGADEDVLFDDVDYMLAAGEKVSAKIVADLLAVSGNLDAGDTIQVTLGETETDQATLVRVEDEGQNALADDDITGSATGDAHVVYDVGFTFAVVSRPTPTVQSGDAAASPPTSDIGTFKITWSATAFDGDVAIDKTCAEDENQGDNGEGLSFIITNTASNGISCTLSSTAESSATSANSWVVPAGQTEEFTLTVAATASADHFAKVYLEAINWDVDANAAAATLFLTTGLGEDKTQTPEVYLNDN